MSDFIIRVFKAWNATEMERSWSNVYEVMSAAEGPTTLIPMANAIVNAERAIHLGPVRFLQYTIATWVPDSHPYDPETFLSVGLDVSGQRGATTGNLIALDYNVCLLMKRNAVTGRTGRLYYRGCLLESDVEMGGDARFALTVDPPAGFAEAQAAYHTALTPYISATAPSQLALIGKVRGMSGLITRRPLTSITLGGVSINKKNHRYFDRV